MMSFKDLTKRAAEALKPKPAETPKKEQKDMASDIGPEKPVADPKAS